MKNNIQRIALTPGEPAGIGPDIVIQLAQTALPAGVVVIADAKLLQARAQVLQLPLKIVDYNPTQSLLNSAATLTVCNVPLIDECIAGQLNSRNSEYVLQTLERATQGCLSGEFNALVTGPVHKGIINAASIPFSGHTEWLAERAGNVNVVMMLATEKLRVALATTHLPLREVASNINTKTLEKTIMIIHQGLQRHFKIADPHILVAGLNPHAGEQGVLGHEEIDIIIPTLKKLRAQRLNLTGPLPADTLFTPKYLTKADAVLAMYHDQGLPVLKYQGFGKAVNITLGLPFLRTSVDHGTALDLAGSGKTSTSSLSAALQMVVLNNIIN